MKRLMVFIDNSNIFRGSRDEGIKIDYEKLVDFLADTGIKGLEKYDLTRAIMYCAVDRSLPELRVKAVCRICCNLRWIPKIDRNLMAHSWIRGA